MTFAPSWKSLLQQKIRQHTSHSVAVIGIGQELCGDDAAGVMVAKHLRHVIGSSDQRPVIVAGVAPENFTGLLRRIHPQLIILVDAAYLGEAPGSVSLLDWLTSDGLSASTHTLPVKLLCEYFTREIGCEVALIGIQAESTKIGQLLSASVNRAVRKVATTLVDFLGDSCPDEQQMAHVKSGGRPVETD